MAAIATSAGTLFVTDWAQAGPDSAKASVHAPTGITDLHDPAAPGTAFLQRPADALGPLPVDATGRAVDWGKALNIGAITPRNGVSGASRATVYDNDVILARTGELGPVRFPHRPHTEWLTCSNCHPAIFHPGPGNEPHDMDAMRQGKSCGVCHGKVAFPLTECSRCHGVVDPRQNSER